MTVDCLVPMPTSRSITIRAQAETASERTITVSLQGSIDDSEQVTFRARGDYARVSPTGRHGGGADADYDSLEERFDRLRFFAWLTAAMKESYLPVDIGSPVRLAGGLSHGLQLQPWRAAHVIRRCRPGCQPAPLDRTGRRLRACQMAARHGWAGGESIGARICRPSPIHLPPSAPTMTSVPLGASVCLSGARREHAGAAGLAVEAIGARAAGAPGSSWPGRTPVPRPGDPAPPPVWPRP